MEMRCPGCGVWQTTPPDWAKNWWCMDCLKTKVLAARMEGTCRCSEVAGEHGHETT